MKIFIILSLYALFWSANALQCIEERWFDDGSVGLEPESITCSSDTAICGSYKNNIGVAKDCYDETNQSECEKHEEAKHCYFCKTDNCNEGDAPPQEENNL